MKTLLEIFYVEDDVSIAQALKEYFEQLNYKVTVFSNIEEAKRTLLRYVPAIVVCGFLVSAYLRKKYLNKIKALYEN
mgnify:CR=1 FL=1